MQLVGGGDTTQTESAAVICKNIYILVYCLIPFLPSSHL